MLKTLLLASRRLVLAAVLGSLVASAMLLAYGVVDSVAVVVRTISSHDVSSKGAKALMLYSIEMFDLFLLGTVMLIMAHSLYELFIDAELKLPSRLQIHTFEDLKASLVTVVVAVMGVTFLGQVMSWDGETQLLGLGAAVALVITALSLYLWIIKSGGPK